MRWALTQVQRIPDQMEALMRAFVLGGALHIEYSQLVGSRAPWALIQARLGPTPGKPEDDPHEQSKEKTRDLLARAGWFNADSTLHRTVLSIITKAVGSQRASEVVSDIVLPTRKRQDADILLSNPFYGVGTQKSHEILTGAQGPKDLGAYLAKVALNKSRDLLREMQRDQRRKSDPKPRDEGDSRDPVENLPSKVDPQHMEKHALLQLLDPASESGKIVHDLIMKTARDFYAGKKRQYPDDFVPPGIQYFDAVYRALAHHQPPPSRTEVARKIHTPSTGVLTRRDEKFRPLTEGMHERSLSGKHVEPILDLVAAHWASNQGLHRKMLEALLQEGFPREFAENAVERMGRIILEKF